MSRHHSAFVSRLAASLASIRSRFGGRTDRTDAEYAPADAADLVDTSYGIAHEERSRRRNMRLLAYSLPLTAMMCISHAEASPASDALIKGFRFFCMRDVSTYRNIESYATAIRLTEASTQLTQSNTGPIATPVVDRAAQARAWIVPAYTGPYQLSASQATNGQQVSENCSVNSLAISGVTMVAGLMHSLHLSAPLQDQRSGDGLRRTLVWRLEGGQRVTLEYSRSGRGLSLSTSNDNRARQMASN